jgi:hypothetical protein
MLSHTSPNSYKCKAVVRRCMPLRRVVCCRAAVGAEAAAAASRAPEGLDDRARRCMKSEMLKVLEEVNEVRSEATTLHQ